MRMGQPLGNEFEIGIEAPNVENPNDTIKLSGINLNSRITTYDLNPGIAEQLGLHEFPWNMASPYYCYFMQVNGRTVQLAMRNITRLSDDSYSLMTSGVILPVNRIRCDDAAKMAIVEFLKKICMQPEGRRANYDPATGYRECFKINYIKLPGVRPLSCNSVCQYASEIGTIEALETDTETCDHAIKLMSELRTLSHKHQIPGKNLRPIRTNILEKEKIRGELEKLFHDKLYPYALKIRGAIKDQIASGLYNNLELSKTYRI